MILVKINDYYIVEWMQLESSILCVESNSIHCVLFYSRMKKWFTAWMHDLVFKNPDEKDIVKMIHELSPINEYVRYNDDNIC